MPRVDWDTRKLWIAIEKNTDDRVLKRIARTVANEARRRCPVGKFEVAASHGTKEWKQRKPGTLKNSIKVKKSKLRGKGYIVSAGGYLAYYAPWVELGAPGRKNYPRQPFLRPAAESVRNRLGF